MPNTSKSSKKAAPVSAAVKPEVVDAFTPLVLNSVERVADLQKKTLDIAAQQATEWMGAWKQAFSYFPVTPPSFIFDVAGQAMQTAIEAQKNAVDLVVEPRVLASVPALPVAADRVEGALDTGHDGEVHFRSGEIVGRRFHAALHAAALAWERTAPHCSSTRIGASRP